MKSTNDLENQKFDTNGNVKVSLQSGSGTIGTVDLDQSTPGTTNGVVINAGEAHIGAVGSNVFTDNDYLIRPANTATYAAQKAINCDLTVTTASYVAGTKTVTLTSNGHGLLPGDYITVAGINSGYTMTNVDGNWLITASDANTFSFVVTNTPTGTTPQTITVTHAVSKMLAFKIGRVGGGTVSIRRITVNMPGLGLGALRLYLYNGQTGTLVDQSTFTILTANDLLRRAYVDLYPVTEGTGSDTTVAVWSGEIMMGTEAITGNVYGRLVKEGSDNAVVSVSAGTVRVMLVGYQL